MKIILSLFTFLSLSLCNLAEAATLAELVGKYEFVFDESSGEIPDNILNQELSFTLSILNSGKTLFVQKAKMGKVNCQGRIDTDSLKKYPNQVVNYITCEDGQKFDQILLLEGVDISQPLFKARVFSSAIGTDLPMIITRK